MHIRQVLAGAQALGSSVSGLLDNARVGIIHLDEQGRIARANDRAVGILVRGDGLSQRNGYLGAWLPKDNVKLQGLLAGALPHVNGQAAAGSMIIQRSGNPQKLVLCINPLEGRPLDLGAPRVAALVVLTEPDSQPRIDAKLVAKVLGLTAAESQVAVMLSEGMTARDIAKNTGRQTSTIYTLIKRAYKKLGISRQAELVRLLLSLADVSAFRG